MGMSASQARLMSLTSRMSDLEFKAQQIQNNKIRLADLGEEASNEYSKALDKEKMTVYTGLKTDGTSSYMNATAANLTTYGAVSSTDKQRFIKNGAGQVVVGSKTGTAYQNAIDSGSNWGSDYTTSVPCTYDTYKKMTLAQLLADHRFVEFAYNMEGRPDLNKDGKNDMTDFNEIAKDSGKMSYYQNQFLEMLQSGYQPVPEDNMKSTEWLTGQIQAGNIFLYEYDKTGGADGTGDFVNINWNSGDTSLNMQSDKTDMAKAEAKYESTMASIQTKDKRFDLELTQINTEHSAIQTEVDSVKKVIDKNIERGFKIFNG